MRISTASMHQTAVSAMLRQQAELSKTQAQVASGKRVQTPADDPVAAVQLQDLSRLQAQQQQFDTNSVAATGRLNLEEQSLADATTLLQRARELVLQANTDTLSDQDRQYIVAELRSRIGELQGIANRKDSSGDYLFSGYKADVPAFQRDAAGVMRYGGDSGARQVQVDAATVLNDSDAGDRVFVNIPSGNGTFTAAVNPANTGSGILGAGAVLQPSAWVADTYTVSFTSATDWEATDSSGNTVANGTYSAGSPIQFRGIQMDLTGTPASGDTFTVASAGTTDVFAALDALVSALGQGSTGDAAAARLHSELNASLQQIDQSLDHLSGVRAEVGARLGLLDDLQSTREDRLVDIASSMSALGDLDYTEAVARMNQQQVGLQAAQQSYAAIARLSLFDYL